MGQDLEKLGEDVRVQGGQGTGERTDLVYNNVTGEFESVPKGSRVSSDEMPVTDMTEKGFYIL